MKFTDMRKSVKKCFQIEYLFLVVALPAILIFIKVVPPAYGLDEQVHAARVYQITQGIMYPQKLHKEYMYGGQLPESFVQNLDYGWATSNQSQRTTPFYSPGRRDDSDPAKTRSLEHQSLDSHKTREYVFGATAPYSPVVYLPASLGIALGRLLDIDVGGIIMLGRLCQALFYIGVVFFALRLIRKRNVAWLLFAIALLPSSIYQSMTINADAFTNAAILLFVSVVIYLSVSHKVVGKKPSLILLAASSLLVALTKPSYAVVLVLILAIPNKNISTVSKRALYTKLTIFGAAILLMVAVNLIGLHYSDAILQYFNTSDAEKMGLSKQLHYIMTHLGVVIPIALHSLVLSSSSWQQSFFGVLGYNTVAMPHVLMLLVGSVLVYLTVTSEYLKSRYVAWGLLLSGVVSGLLVVALLYLTFNPVGALQVQGVQGRYFVPSAVMLLTGFGAVFDLVPFRSYTTGIKATVCISVALGLYVTVIAYAMAVL